MLFMQIKAFIGFSKKQEEKMLHKYKKPNMKMYS